MDEDYTKSLNLDQSSVQGTVIGKRKNSAYSGVKCKSDKNTPRKLSAEIVEKPKPDNVAAV